MPGVNEQEQLFGRFSRRRKPADEVLHLDIELDGTEVRRRISIPANFTLEDLHLAVQIAMGWTNRYLHSFIVNDREYVDRMQRLYRRPRRTGEEAGRRGAQEPDGQGASGAQERDGQGASGPQERLGPAGPFLEENQRLEAVFASTSRIEYRYNFLDKWNHLISLVDRMPPEESGMPAIDGRMPRLMEGRGACPPEDLGGAPAYRALVEAVAQTARGEEPAGADEAIRAYARSFDPDAVDVEYANDLFQGAFLIGEKEAQRRRDAGLARLVAEEDRRRHEEESWFLNPRLVLPKEVVRAGKRVARVGLTPIRTATTAGFFVGLHAAPELIPPSVWLPVLLDYPEGEREREFRDQDEAESFFSLLLIAYNATGTALSSGELPLPFSYVSSDPDSVERARDWVDGFLTAFSLCSDTSVVTGHDRGARALFTLDLLHGDEAERFAQRQDRAVDFTPAELRRYALDNLVENVSYIYALAREAGAAYGGPAAEAGPTGTGGPPAPGAPADPAGFIDPSDEGPTHGSDAGSTRGSDTTHQERLTPQQRRNRRKRRRKK